jgi:hypothetical protein
MANDVVEYRAFPNANITLKYNQVYFRVLKQGETIKAIINYDVGLITLIISDYDVFGAMPLTASTGGLLRKIWNQQGRIFRIT